MFEASLCPQEMLSLRSSSFLAPTEGGVRSWVILLILKTGTARSTTGEANDTISLDSKRCLWMEPVLYRLQRRKPQDNPLLNLNFAEFLLLFSRAGANTWIWYHIKAATLELRWTGPKTKRWSPQQRGRWKSAKSVRRYEKKRTCSPKMVRARSISPSTLRALQQPSAIGFASWPCLTDTASTASSFVIHLFKTWRDMDICRKRINEEGR